MSHSTPSHWFEKFIEGMGDMHTLQDYFLEALKKFPDHPYAGVFQKDNSLKWYTQKELHHMAMSVGSSLVDIGIQVGDRVGIYCENNLNAVLLYEACHLYNFVAISSFDTGMASYPSYVFADANCKVLYVSKIKSEKLIPMLRAGISGLRFLLLDEHVEGHAFPEYYISDFYNHEWYALPRVAPSDVCTIIYSSGTCGAPKGVVLSHDAFLRGIFHVLCAIPPIEPVVHVSFLPMAHVLERITILALRSGGAKIVLASDNTKRVREDLKNCQSTGGAIIPKILSGFHSAIMSKFDTPPKKVLMDGLLKLTDFCRWIGFRSRLADALAFDVIKDSLGGRLDWYVVAGDCFSKQIHEDLQNILDIRIFPIYGLSEAAGPVSITSYRAIEAGTTGFLCPGIEAKISEENEILLKGTCIFKSYWMRPDVKQAAMTPDGWFRTGDRGSFDKYGNLIVSGRCYDMVTYIPGLTLAIPFLCYSYKKSPLVDDIFILPIAEFKCLIAIVCTPLRNLTWFNKQVEPQSQDEIQTILNTPEFIEWVLYYIRKFGVEEEKLAKAAILEAVRVTVEPFTVENGLLTATGKQRPGEFKLKYKREIEEMIAEIGKRQAL